MTLRILHLYPRELGINGDRGNVMALRLRAEWRGIEVEIIDHHPGSALPESVDLVHIGSGPLTGQAAVREDLALITPALREWKARDVPFLAIAAGWQLLGRSVSSTSGEVLAGVGIFDSTATLLEKRVVGEIVLDTSLGRTAGFVNHNAMTDSSGDLLGTDVVGGAAEGLRSGSSIATNLHGSFLPMNPVWADVLLSAALGEPLTADLRLEAVDTAAAAARAAIAGRLGIS